MTTPIVFIHWSETDYLWLAANQATKHNEKVLVMIDPQPIKYSMEIDRWLVLRDFMISNKLNRCVYLDSDVLLYKNVDKDFTKADLAFSRHHSGHTMFVNNLRALDDFCYYAERWINTDPKPLIEGTRLRNPDGVFADTLGDMVLLDNFIHNFTYSYEDVSTIKNGEAYDHNINTDGFPQCRAEGIPYRIFPDGTAVRMNSLHFQGGAKEKMKGFIE